MFIRDLKLTGIASKYCTQTGHWDLNENGTQAWTNYTACYMVQAEIEDESKQFEVRRSRPLCQGGRPTNRCQVPDLWTEGSGWIAQPHGEVIPDGQEVETAVPFEAKSDPMITSGRRDSLLSLLTTHLASRETAAGNDTLLVSGMT